MEITKDRLNHCLAVARKMRELVSAFPTKYSANPNDAFILGFVHDIGYEFCTIQSEHAHIGGLQLKEQGFKYWKEVYYHGIPQEQYTSDMLSLLNYADMTTGPMGDYMTIQERISDIADRYGTDSRSYKDAIKLLEIMQIH